MRTIKFRAWSKKWMKMWDWEVDGQRQFDLNKEIDNPDTILMQYIGLKDKTGKEIYCSDLIKTPAGTGEVIWEDGCYRIYWNHRDNTTLHDTKPEQMEVVGNKYEGLQNAGKGDII